MRGYDYNLEAYLEYHDKELFLDPKFWQALFGEEGRIKALEFINYIFDGKTIENYFRDL